MRVFQRALLLTIVACAALVAVDKSASAQTTEPKPDRVAVRLGIFFPTNSRIKNQVGNAIPVGGIDATIGNPNGSTRIIATIGYMDRTDGGRQLQMIPVTVGEQWYQTDKGGHQSPMYFGWGAGAYFTSANVLDDLGNVDSRDKTLFGGYLNLGVEAYQGLFVDARYHMVTSSGSVSPGGLELTAGYRF